MTRLQITHQDPQALARLNELMQDRRRMSKPPACMSEDSAEIEQKCSKSRSDAPGAIFVVNFDPWRVSDGYQAIKFYRL